MQRGAGGTSAALQHERLPLSYTTCKAKLGHSRSLPTLTQLPSRVLAHKPVPPSTTISRRYMLSRTVGVTSDELDSHRFTLRERLASSDRLAEGLRTESLAKLDAILAERGPVGGFLPSLDKLESNMHKFRSQDISCKTGLANLPGPLQPEEDLLLGVSSSSWALTLPAAGGLADGGLAAGDATTSPTAEAILAEAVAEPVAVLQDTAAAEQQQQLQQPSQPSLLSSSSAAPLGPRVGSSPSRSRPAQLVPGLEQSNARSQEQSRSRSPPRSSSPVGDGPWRMEQARSPARSKSPPPWRLERAKSPPRSAAVTLRPTSGRANNTQSEPFLPVHAHRVSWGDTFWLEEIPCAAADAESPGSGRRRRKPHPVERANAHAERHRAPGAAAHASAALAGAFASNTRKGPVLLNSSEAAIARKQLLDASNDPNQPHSRWRLRSLEKNSLRAITIAPRS